MPKQYKENQKVLKEITDNVPERLKNALMKKSMNTEQEETVRALIKNPGTSSEIRDKLKKELEAGEFRFEEEIVDEKIAKELDSYYEVEVKKAIKEGRLGSPDEDPYYQKMVARFDKANSK